MNRNAMAHTTGQRVDQMKLTAKEIDELSTPEERAAKHRYEALQQQCRKTGTMGETDLLIASEAIAILVARNKRLGLVK